jgi:hypothetical protein
VEHLEEGVEVVGVLIDVNNHYGPFVANTRTQASDGRSHRSQRVFPLRRAIVGDDEWISSWSNG